MTMLVKLHPFEPFLGDMLDVAGDDVGKTHRIQHNVFFIFLSCGNKGLVDDDKNDAHVGRRWISYWEF